MAKFLLWLHSTMLRKFTLQRITQPECLSNKSFIKQFLFSSFILSFGLSYSAISINGLDSLEFSYSDSLLYDSFANRSYRFPFTFFPLDTTFVFTFFSFLTRGWVILCWIYFEWVKSASVSEIFDFYLIYSLEWSWIDLLWSGKWDIFSSGKSESFIFFLGSLK